MIAYSINTVKKMGGFIILRFNNKLLKNKWRIQNIYTISDKTYLIFGNLFNQPINTVIFPPNITHIKFG